MSTDIPPLPYRFALKRFTVSCASKHFELTTVAEMNDLIEEITSEEFSADERLPYWAELWHSSIALSERLLEMNTSMEGKSVLDLGCGLGLTGIVAAQLGGSVTFTDIAEDALAFSRYNLMRNCDAPVVARCAFEMIDWRLDAGRTWDVILAADVIYETRMMDPLLQFFLRAISSGGRIMLAEPHRAVAENFLPILQRAGFTTHSSEKEIIWDHRKISVGVHEISPFTKQPSDASRINPHT